MTITAYDTNTGQALTVTAVEAELARQDGAELHIAQDAVIRPVLQLEHMVAEAQAWHNIAHRCRKILNGHWHEQVDLVPVPEFAGLPPDPTLQLTQDALDAEEAEREKRRRAAVLAPVGQREQVWAQPTKPFVPKAPWQIRVKRAVVAVLQRDAEERAL